MARETPARHMRDDAIARELALLALRWTQLRVSEPEGGGSPGEGMWERMGELEHEQQRRAAGGEIDRTVPLQSR